EPAGDDEHDGIDHSQHWALVQSAFAWDQTGIEKRPGHGPDQKEASHRSANASAAVTCVGSDDVPPIGKPREDGHHGGPAEPPQGVRHEGGEYFSMWGRVQYCIEGQVTEII